MKETLSTGTSKDTCALCALPVGKNPMVDGENAFCCPGCHAVYNILASRSELGSYEESPVFEQAVRCGLISNPELAARIKQRSQCNEEGQERKRLHFEITDLWCPSCAQVIQWVVLQMKGVLRCVVDYATDMAVIEYVPTRISKERILRSVGQLGYHTKDFLDPSHNKVEKALLIRLFVALFCSLNVMMMAYPIYASYFSLENSGHTTLFAWLSFALALPVVTYCATPLWRRAFSAARLGIYGMEALVGMAVLAAMTYSMWQLAHGSSHVYFDSMCVVITFVLLGKVIEAKAKFSAKETLLRLAQSAPKRARVQKADGSETFVFVKEISEGDKLVVVAGERVALEGVVIEGVASVDESAMTGEPLPVPKEVGSEVLSGTLLQQGRLVIRVTACQEASLLHRILGLAEQDLAHKGQRQRLVDLVIQSFVPVILLVALSTLLVTYFSLGMEEAVLRAVSVLLISCPCAIGIAAPLVESLLLGRLAQCGVIIRNRACLPLLGHEDLFVFDKTGTVTEGNFEVSSGLDALEAEEAKVLKGLVKHSIHPIAEAVDNALHVTASALSEVEELIGRGLRGKSGESNYLFGSEALMRLSGVTLHGALGGLHTQVFVAKDGQHCATLELADRVREGVPRLMTALKPTKTALLSGDSTPAVEAVAQACGITTWKGECTPLEKRDYIDHQRQEGRTVAFVGDGINDAPALSAAHVGISVVSATDISIQVSDVLLATDKLEVMIKVRSLGQKGQRIIRQNIFWAFSYNVIGVVLATMGMLTPIYAAVAMVCSSLIVSANALRLKAVH